MQALEGQVGSRRAIRFLGFEEISAHVEEVVERATFTSNWEVV